jgi:hypothetical protein
MKKIAMCFAIITIVLMTLPNEISAQSTAKKTVLDIYYTHSTNRCPGCKAIENQTKETLESQFKQETTDGKIVFHLINIDLKENKAFVEEHQVWGSGLFMINSATKKNVDLTKEGFAMARSKPEEFRSTLAKAIRENLGQ